MVLLWAVKAGYIDVRILNGENLKVNYVHDINMKFHMLYLLTMIIKNYNHEILSNCVKELRPQICHSSRHDARNTMQD